MKPHPFNLLILLALGIAAAAAEGPGPDELFAQARELGFSGQRREAREICQRILERSPGYHDVRVFFGRLYSWDKQYDRAREQFLQVLEERSDHLEARNALLDVELWSDHPRAALRYSEEGLEQHPDNPELLYRKARALSDLREHAEAYEVAQQAASAKPGWAEAERLVERLKIRGARFKASADVTYEDFNNIDPWRDLSLELRRTFRRGAVIGRVNLADRFGRSAEQYEVDGYPKLGRGRYFYLNAGYSSSGLFPDWRFGAEYFSRMPRKMEGSIGFRYLDFTSSDVTLYTGSIGAHRGNYFVWLRPFVSDKDEGTSYSGSLYIRRYFRNVETYYTLIVGAGSSPEEDLTIVDVVRQDSWKVRLDAQRSVRDGWIIKGLVGFRSEEFPNGTRDSWQVGFGVERLF